MYEVLSSVLRCVKFGGRFSPDPLVHQRQMSYASYPLLPHNNHAHTTYSDSTMWWGSSILAGCIFGPHRETPCRDLVVALLDTNVLHTIVTYDRLSAVKYVTFGEFVLASCLSP